MAIEQKEAQAKEFLDRADIVTMKKDIKRLREADAFKESAKITTAPIVSQRPPKPNLDFAKKVPVVAMQENTPPLPQKISDDKTNATEDEKQKIFLLESQSTLVEGEIHSLNEKKSSLDGEKNAIAKEKENWQQKLNPLVKAQQTGSEEQKQTIEKERWPIETELEKIENRGKDIEAKYKELEASKNQLTQKITQIGNSLKEIHSGVEKRTKEAENTKQATIVPPVAPKVEKQPAPVADRSAMGKPKEPEKPYLKNVPPAVKEKLAESLNSEEQQRRKFLEDIDKWASFHNNQGEPK